MILGKYNQAKTVTFDIVAPDGVDLIISATFASGDIKIMKDEGAEANTSNLPADEGTGYSLVLTATEMSAARIRIYIIDQTATKVWLDISLGLETYGNASAEHAFDLDTASVAQAGDNYTRLGAPAGADVSADIAALQADTDNIQTRLPAALAGGLMRSDVIAISAGTLAADNLSSQYDTTGITGDTFPSTQQQVGNLSSGSAAISVAAESRTLTIGTEVNSVADTEALDGVYHEISSVAGAMDIYYQFDVGGNGVAVEVSFVGRLNGNNDSIAVQAYDWAGAVWTQVGTLNGVNGTTDSQEVFNILVKHTGAGANLGKVRVRGFAASGLTSAVLFLDQVFLSFSVVAQSVGYSIGKVWVDTVNGVAGTVSFVNGTADNPSRSIADGTIIAGNVGLSSYNVAPGSTVTLDAPYSAAIATIYGATLILNGQDISNTNTFGGTVSGITTGTGPVFFTDTEIQDVTFPPAHFDNCSLSGTFTIGSVGIFVFTKCYSEVISSNPIIDFVALGATELNMRQYSGGIEFQNMASGDAVQIEGNGAIVINANCTAGTISYRGNFEFTDNAGGAVTVVRDDNSTSIIAIEADTNELQGDWTNGGRLDLLLDQLITQVDTASSEPGQGAPPVSAKMALKIDYLYKWTRNRTTSTATGINHYADDATTVDQKATHSDDGSTYERTEFIAGP